jgi:hypothetical protein
VQQQVLSGISAYATASVTYTGSPPPPLPPLSASANATDTTNYYTTGPSRPGFIEFTLEAFILSSHGGVGDVDITDGVHTYNAGAGAPPGKCGVEGCSLYTATLPFDLGTGFQISAFAGGSASVTPSSPTLGSAQGGQASVTSFRLFEANGTTPVPFSAVPEPSNWGLLIISISLCLAAAKTFSFSLRLNTKHGQSKNEPESRVQTISL